MRLLCRVSYNAVQQSRRSVHFTLGVGIVLAGFAVASVAFAAKPAATPKTTTVKVLMTEYKFALSPKTVPAGTVIFKLVNKGQVEHNMVFNGPIIYAKSPLVLPKKTYTLKVKFKTPGRYNFVCTLHFELGMSGTIKVT
jgi:plastocyanin